MIDQYRLVIIEECVDVGVAKRAATFKAAHYTKAVVHTYLALQDKPGKPLGQAITAESLRSAASPTARLLPRQESFASLHILTRRASEGSEALPSLARRVRMSFFGARVIFVSWLGRLFAAS